MREYETVYIASPQMTDANIASLNARLKGLIEKNNGQLLYARELGKKSLAYRIGKQTKGIYYCLDFAASGNCVKEMEHSLQLDENVLRFLTVTKSEDVDIKTRMTEIEARGEALQDPTEPKEPLLKEEQ